MLTVKQKRFVDEYLKDLNATQAAIRAGYSASSANSNAARLMVNDGIKNEIANKKSEIRAQNKLTKEKVIQELSKGAFAPIDVSEIKFSDKIKCLELLCKHLGLLDGTAGTEEKDKKASMDRLWQAINNIGIGSRGKIDQNY